MKNTVKALILSAAVSGILSGSALRAQTANANSASKHLTSAKVGLTSGSFDDKDKHACKGKNDCKGKGGCKSATTAARDRTPARARAAAPQTAPRPSPNMKRGRSSCCINSCRISPGENSNTNKI